MWPKVFAQLVELLPHITRLVPMADMFFQTKTASEKANEGVIRAMAETVRGDLGQVTAAHAGLYRQLQEQSAQLAEVAADARLARTAVEQYTLRTALLEKQIASLGIWIKSAALLLLAVLALLVTLLLRAR